MHRYKVKFNCFGAINYGIIRDDKPSPSEGFIWVEDAIDGEMTLVSSELIQDIEDISPRFDFDQGKWVGGDEYELFIQKEYDKAVEKDILCKRELKVGKLLRYPTGDGFAFYVVTKVNKETCSLEWRAFCPDRWVNPHFGYGKTVSKDFVRGMC